MTDRARFVLRYFMACTFYQCVSYVPFLMDDPGELSLYIRERGAGPCGESADASKCGVLYRDYGAVRNFSRSSG
jgi:hypothetical protein